jgi:hypothetical protein
MALVLICAARRRRHNILRVCGEALRPDSDLSPDSSRGIWAFPDLADASMKPLRHYGVGTAGSD